MDTKRSVLNITILIASHILLIVAIIYSIYKPIVDGDGRQIAALYGLYRRL